MSVSGGAAVEITIDGSQARKRRPYALCATGVETVEETSTRDSIEVDSLDALAIHPELATEPTLEELRSRFPEARIGETRAPEERVGSVCGDGVPKMTVEVTDSDSTAGFGAQIQNRDKGQLELWLVNDSSEYWVGTDERRGFVDPGQDDKVVGDDPTAAVKILPETAPVTPPTKDSWDSVAPGSYEVEIRGEAEILPIRADTPIEKPEGGGDGGDPPEGEPCPSCEPGAPPLPGEGDGQDGDDGDDGGVVPGVPELPGYGDLPGVGDDVDDPIEVIFPPEGSNSTTIAGVGIWAVLLALLIGAFVARASGGGE